MFPKNARGSSFGGINRTPFKYLPNSIILCIFEGIYYLLIKVRKNKRKSYRYHHHRSKKRKEMKKYRNNHSYLLAEP